MYYFVNSTGDVAISPEKDRVIGMTFNASSAGDYICLYDKDAGGNASVPFFRHYQYGDPATYGATTNYGRLNVPVNGIYAVISGGITVEIFTEKAPYMGL